MYLNSKHYGGHCNTTEEDDNQRIPYLVKKMQKEIWISVSGNGMKIVIRITYYCESKSSKTVKSN